MNLTVANVANGYTSKTSGNIGTMVFFEEKQTKGDFKGSAFNKWFPSPDYVMETEIGWTYDEENDRVNPPVVTRQSQRKADLSLMHELGMEIRF